jgi:hypothetical protein
MSRKTIITDFRALKGKITLSDAKDIHSGVEKKTVTPQPKAEESHLKVGQSVVLMDSSLRGHIVSLGKRVRIELEDGQLNCYK